MKKHLSLVAFLAFAFALFGADALAKKNAPTLTVAQNDLVECLDGSYAVRTCAPGNQLSGTIYVATEIDLQNAVANAASGSVIELASGTYSLTNTLVVTKPNITIQGATGNPVDVQLVGLGMDNASYGTVQHGIWTNQPGLTVRNLTIRDVYAHGIVFNSGAENPTIYNVRLLDTGEQFIKANPTAWGDGVDNGTVTNSYFEYTAGTPNHTGTVGYSNGIDVLGGHDWVIRDNTFKSFHTPDSADFLWNPAILMWHGARGTLVERNTFIDCTRAIAFGLNDDPNGYSHQGGIIRNNFISYSSGLFTAWRTSGSDAAIIVWDSANTQVLHNTVFTQGNLNHAIELRFATSGSLVANNLTDDSINTRDGATYSNVNNSTAATSGMFVDAINGDLHLSSAATQVARLAEVSSDIDNTARTDPTDAGAHEFAGVETPPDPTPTNIDNMNYLGAFRLPSGDFGSGYQPTVNFSYGAIGYDKDNHAMWVASSENHGGLAPFPIPTLVNSTTLTDLNIAPNPTQNFFQITGIGNFDTSVGDNTRLTGFYQNNGKLMATAHRFYSSAPISTQFIMFGDSTDIANSPRTDWLPAQNGLSAGAGWISPIPPEYQAAFGGNTHIGGLSSSTNRADNVNPSIGPAAYAFRADEDLENFATRTQVNNTALIHYGLNSNQLVTIPDMESGLNPLWSSFAEASFGIIIPGSNIYRVFGKNGGGTSGLSYMVPPYGSGQKGWWPNDEYDQYNYYWDYSVQDMIAVYNGTMQPHEIRPIAVGEFDAPFQGGRPLVRICGGSFDEANAVLYLSLYHTADRLQQNGNSYAPVILAYEFDVPDPQFNVAEDLTYLGAFKLPHGINGDAEFAYSQSMITYNSDNDSLFMSGFIPSNASRGIIEVDIPVLVTDTSSVSNLNTAPILQNFKEVLSSGTNSTYVDEYGATQTEVMNNIGGLQYESGQLFVNAYNYYDALGVMDDTTLVIRNANDLANSVVDGFFQVNGAANMSGHIAPIPSALQVELGGTHISGQNGIPIITRTSAGPAGWVWDLADIGPTDTGGSIASTALLNYPYANRLRDDMYNTDLTNDMWTYESRAPWGFIPKGYRSYVFFGHSGGHADILEYKGTKYDGTVCGGPCAIDPDDLYNFTWTYTLDDLVSVKNAQMQPYDPEPHTYGEFIIPFRTSTDHEIYGGTYDMTGNRIFLVVYGVDWPNPIVLVYQVATSG